MSTGSNYTLEELKEAGLLDFRVFLANLWAYLGLPAPTPTQYEIAYWLQHGPQRFIIQAFRGVGKSWITVAYLLWRLRLNPQEKVMIVSASQTLAENASKFALDIIRDWPVMQDLAPRRDQRQSFQAFDVGPARPSKDPSFKAAGITGQITGNRANIIVPDDIEIPKNSFTHHLREKLSDQVKEFDAILSPGDENRIILLGTPQVEDSIYPKLTKRGYETMIWTAEVPEKPEVYKGRLGPRVQKMVDRGVAPLTPVEPTRFPLEELLKRKASYGLAGWALQFMLDTTPASAERNPLKTRDLIVHDLDAELTPVRLVWANSPDLIIENLASGGLEGDLWLRPMWRSDEMTPYSGTVMAIDPSGQGNDETAYAIVKFAHGLQYICEVGGFKAGFAEETLQALAAAMLRWNVNYYIIERNYGGGMFDELLRPHVIKAGAKASQDLEWEAWSTGKKEWRILDTLEPAFKSHRLVINRTVIEEDMKVQEDREAYSLIYQMTRMARLQGVIPHEDRLEALAMAVGYWTQKMGRDVDQTVDDHKAKLLKKELDEWHKHVHVNPKGFGLFNTFGGRLRPSNRRPRLR